MFLFALKSWLVTPDLPWCCSRWPVLVVKLCLQTLWARLECLFNSISRRMLWTTNQQWPPLEGDKLLVDEGILGLLRKCYCRFLLLCCMGRCANSFERTACTKWPLRGGKVLLWPKDSFVWKQDCCCWAWHWGKALLNAWDLPLTLVCSASCLWNDLLKALLAWGITQCMLQG